MGTVDTCSNIAQRYIQLSAALTPSGSSSEDGAAIINNNNNKLMNIQ